MTLRSMFNTGYRFVLFSALVISSLPSFSQNYAGHNWYFGQSTNAIRFSRSNNTANLLTPKAALGLGGSATVSDAATGNLLFYTNGVQVFDATNAVMPGGALTGDATRNQGVVVCKVPGQTDQYYIIHSDAGGTIRSTKVDMSLVGNAVAFGQPPLGEVIVAERNVAIPSIPGGQSQGMIIIPHDDGENFWLITHTAGTTNYNISSITAGGIALFATATTGLIQNVANFSYHAATGQIAVSPNEINRNVEILTFNNTAAAAFTSNRAVLNSSVTTATNQIYDTEWNNSGRYLYVSTKGVNNAPPGNVLQFDLTDATLPPASVLPSGVFNSYGLQIAPDSAIYHLYESAAGVFRLGKLTDIDSVANLTTYDPSAFPSNPDFDARQFSSFAPQDSVLLTASFTFQGTCTNAPTTFFPSVQPAADSLRWDFGDGQFSSEWSPIHTYQAGGTNPVTARLTAFLNGDSISTTQVINLTQFDVQISVVQDTTACSCELPFPKNPSPVTPPPTNPCNPFTIDAQISGTGSISWEWFISGESVSSGTGTTATLTPDSAGFYYLVATVSGCSTYAGVNIAEYGLFDARANIWFFGDRAGIDFNPLPADPTVPVAKPTTNPVMNAPEGTATISDRNGQVIFFTDGETVWDDEFNVVASGVGGQQGSTQSSLIIQVPGDETLYYIFTTQEVYSISPAQYEVRYTLYDVKTKSLVGPSQVLFTQSTERITGSENWLIAHEFGNNSFRAYRITAQGIENPVITSIGSVHSYAVAENGQGYMKLGANNMLAVALSTPGVSNVVELFDFVDSTGVVTNFRVADLETGVGQVYGVEISPGGNKLFATLKNSPSPSRLYEFSIDSLGNPYLRLPLQAQVNEELGAIETGPDGQIYVAVNGESFVGTIQVNEDTTQTSTFVLNGFPLAGGTTSQLGLPNFTQNLSNAAQNPALSISGFCLGDSTIFSGTATNNIDTLTYIFGDGGFARGVNLNQVSHIYAAPGTYFVELHIDNRCEGPVAILRDTITINAPPANFARSETLCQPPHTLDPYPGVPNLPYDYVWGTGDSTRTIQVTTPGNYVATVTDTITGCVTSDAINVVPFLTIDLGPDEVVCSAPGQAQTLTTGIANNTNHEWRLNGVNLGNTTGSQNADLSTQVGSPFEYTVTFFEDPLDPTACFVRDTIVFVVNQSPSVTLTGSADVPCNSPTGQVTATVAAFPTATLTFNTFGATSGFNDVRTNQSSGMVVISNTLVPDTYTIFVTDQLSNCFDSDTHVINTTGITPTATSKAICAPEGIDVTAPVGSLTYTVRDAGTGADILPINQPTGGAANFTTFALPVGSYTIEVMYPGNCPSSATATLSQAAQFNVTFDQSNLCAADQVTAVAAGATTFSWTGTGILSGASTSTVTVDAGTHTLSVSVDDGAGGNCLTTGTVTVTVDNFVPDFTFTGACIGNNVTLTATQPVGNYIYRWFRAGTVASVGSGSSISVATTGDYTLQVQNPITGCPFVASAPKTVNVEGPLNVVIMPQEIPCTNAEAIAFEAITNRPVVSYEWSFNGTIVATQNTDTFTENRGNGDYTVVVRTANCLATDTWDDPFAEPTPGQLPTTAIICPDPDNPDPTTRSVRLYPGIFSSYDWSTGSTADSIIVSVPGQYSVSLVNVLGCSSEDMTTVIENCVPRITGPNAFRPSGLNQEFYLFTRYVLDADFQVFIFNRWGEMVFESTDKEFRWNGGYNNNNSQPLPPGTYSYVVKYKSIYVEDGTREHRGGVVLLR